MKGYIQGIQSENLSEKASNVKTHLWYTSIDTFTIGNNLCEFSFRWETYTYNIKATTNNDFNYTGTIQVLGYESKEINFCHYINNNRNLLIGDYLDDGIAYRFVIEVS